MACCGKGKKTYVTSEVLIKKRVSASQLKMQTESISGNKHKFVLVKPQFYGISYSINPWMDVNNGADRYKAIKQWTELEGTLRYLNSKILKISPRRNLPDMVFTANAGFFPKNQETFVLSNFFHSERKGEEFWFKKFFDSEGFHVKEINMPFEGAGDCLYLGGNLIGGYGFRTNKEVYDSLVNDDVTKVKLVDPYFYHLDTCFCPLQSNDYLIWPGAFESSSLESIRKIGRHELAIPEEEAKQFACNAIMIEKNVILPSNCPKTESILNEFGYKTFPLEMSEFIKAGGACKCLTLEIP